MKTVLVATFAALLMASTASAQTTCMDLGQGMITCKDTNGNTVTGIDLGGGLTKYSDNNGKSVICMDLGGGMTSCN